MTARPQTPRRPQPWILVVAAAWAIAVPYLARLDVDPTVEVVDHVVPGVILLAAAGAVLGAGWRPGSAPWLAAAAVALLAGLWITATHVPLLPEILDGTAPALTGLLHLSAGPPVAATGLWMVLAR
ncbi:MAG TPA: hypothetical protein VM266_17350 [Solirubrobacteraceae bacterium]|nr:hypothetical protein [Solirubrobacteraceae bacterium]